MSTDNKTVIYLDQNFISDISKLALENKKDKINPLLKALFETIKKGVDEEKFLSPDSWIHALETAAETNPDLQDAIYSYQGYLGQVSLNEPWDIRNVQFWDSLLGYYGKKTDEGERWRTAFQENPNKRMENFRIKARMPALGINGLDQASIDNLQKIRESGVLAKDQYAKEMEAARKEYKALLRHDYSYLLKKHNISIEQAEKFIDSRDFAKISNIDIFCQLWSENLAKKVRKKEQLSHDYNDIQFISSYMPYCDIIATDKYMKSLLVALKFDSKYNCCLYTLRDNDLNEFISSLEEDYKEKKPINSSLFSVVCEMTNGKVAYSLEFLKKINSARSKFQNTGKYWNKEVYTEIFLIYPNKTEIEMPESQEVSKRGPQAFMLEQWIELFTYASNLKKIYNSDGGNIENLINEIPAYLRGSAVALLNDNLVFDEKDLFYDIEEAIEERLENSQKYNVRIFYSN